MFKRPHLGLKKPSARVVFYFGPKSIYGIIARDWRVFVEKKTCQIKGLKIAYVLQGQGDKYCVIAHGWGTNIETMMGVYEQVKKNYRVLLYDAPGFGQSDDPQEVWGTEDYADFLKDLCDHFEIDKADFIGHSFGGKTLTIFAVKYPDLVRRLVLIDASGVLPKRGLDYYFKVYSFKFLKKVYLFFHRGQGRDKALEGFYKKFGSDDYQASQGIMRKTFVKVVNESTEAYFPKISQPTLLIWGRQDEATPLWMGKVFEEKIPDAGLVELNGGHYGYVDDYGSFCAVIGSFLKD